MKNLVILTGLSCTLKSSVTDVLINKYNFNPLPDVNRGLLDTCNSILSSNFKKITSVKYLPNLLLCSHRLLMYNLAVECNRDSDVNFVCQRTVFEHIFFKNSSLLGEVGENELREAELKFFNNFDNVILVNIANLDDNMLKTCYLSDAIRNPSNLDVNQYKEYQVNYIKFVEKLKPFDLHFVIEPNSYPDHINELINFISDQIIKRINNGQ